VINGVKMDEMTPVSVVEGKLSEPNKDGITHQEQQDQSEFDENKCTKLLRTKVKQMINYNFVHENLNDMEPTTLHKTVSAKSPLDEIRENYDIKTTKKLTNFVIEHSVNVLSSFPPMRKLDQSFQPMKKLDQVSNEFTRRYIKLKTFDKEESNVSSTRPSNMSVLSTLIMMKEKIATESNQRAADQRAANQSEANRREEYDRITLKPNRLPIPNLPKIGRTKIRIPKLSKLCVIAKSNNILSKYMNIPPVSNIMDCSEIPIILKRNSEIQHRKRKCLPNSDTKTCATRQNSRFNLTHGSIKSNVLLKCTNCMEVFDSQSIDLHKQKCLTGQLNTSNSFLTTETGLEVEKNRDGIIPRDLQKGEKKQTGSMKRLQSKVEREAFKCKLCGLTMKYLKQYKIHMIHEHKLTLKDIRPFHCPKCDFSMKTKDGILTHIVARHNKTISTCNKCNFRSRSIVLLLKHKYEKHCGAKSYLTCDQCEYICTRTGAMYYHKTQKHNVKHAITQCGIKTKEKLHSIEKPLQCAECLYTCEVKQSLKTHIYAMHCKVKYICDTCLQTFRYFATFNTHMLKVHKDGEFFKCKYCKYKSHVHFHVIRHEKNHTKINILSAAHALQKQNHLLQKYECKLCRLTFKSKTYLRMHVSLRHNNHNGYRCKLCTFTCNNQTYLRMHFNKHKPNILFECSVCKKKFRHKVRLEIHVRSHKISLTKLDHLVQTKHDVNIQPIKKQVTLKLDQISNEFTRRYIEKLKTLNKEENNASSIS